jgi:hypothetical protein
VRQAAFISSIKKYEIEMHKNPNCRPVIFCLQLGVEPVMAILVESIHKMRLELAEKRRKFCCPVVQRAHSPKFNNYF